MSDADTLAAELATGIETERLRQRADNLALRTAAFEAGLPLQDRPQLTKLFLDQYDGPADADHLVAAWHRQVLDDEPPDDVLDRLADRDADERIAYFREALDQPRPDEEAASA